MAKQRETSLNTIQDELDKKEADIIKKWEEYRKNVQYFYRCKENKLTFIEKLKTYPNTYAVADFATRFPRLILPINVNKHLNIYYFLRTFKNNVDIYSMLMLSDSKRTIEINNINVDIYLYLCVRSIKYGSLRYAPVYVRRKVLKELEGDTDCIFIYTLYYINKSEICEYMIITATDTKSDYNCEIIQKNIPGLITEDDLDIFIPNDKDFST
jgi:hypothetical protein